MKTEKSKRLKGAVLLTVVSVMSLLIIFLMGTLLLASAARERAHRSYSTSQAEYTARTAIESFSQAMQDNAGIAQSVVNMKKNDSFEPTVVINSAGMGSVGYYDNNNQWVDNKLQVECVDETYVYSNDSKKWEPQQVIKVSATAKVGREEKTVTAYLRKKAPDETKPTKIKGFQSLGDGGFTTTKGYMSGDFTLGLLDSGNKEYHFNNDSVVDTGVTFINGTLNIGAQIDILASKTGSGTVIMGDYNDLNGKGITIKVDYPYAEWNDSTSSVEKIELTQNKIPYFYVDGNLIVNNTFNVIANGIDTARQLRKDAPFNIFCGSFKHLGNNVNIASDIYIMGHSGSSQFGTNGGTSKLSAWSSSIANKTNTQFYSEGGSIYSNEDLALGQAVIRGDVHVHGNLDIIHNNLTIYGDLVVDGKILKNGNVATPGVLDGVVKGKIYNGTNPQTGTGGLADNIYMKENTYVTGSYLKPGYVKVQNFEYGNVAVENVPIQNVKYNNTQYANYVFDSQIVGITEHVNNRVPQENVKTINVKVDYLWNQEKGANDIIYCDHLYDDIEIFDENGDSHPISDYAYRDIYEIDGHYFSYIPYVNSLAAGEDDRYTSYSKSYEVVYADGTKGTKLAEGYTIYKADKDGKPTSEVVNDGSLSIIYKVDKDGKPTDEVTNDAVIIYKVDAEGNPTDDVTTTEYSYIKVDKDGNKTDVVVDSMFTYYKPDQNGNATDVETSERSFYYRADGNGFLYVDDEGNPEEVSEVFSYYKLSAPDNPVDETEALNNAGEGKYLAWYDENQNATDMIYYYNEDPNTATGDLEQWHLTHNVSKDNAYNSVAIYPLSAYTSQGKEVYPKSMTRDSLLGKNNSGNYKVVTTLDDVKETLGYRSTGFDANVYYDDVPGATITGGKYVGFDYIDVNSGNTYDISNNTVIKTGITSSGPVVININPKGANIWVVLDNCSFGDAEHRIVVNGKGTVNFLIKGNVSLIKVGIYTKSIYDQYSAGGNIIIREDDKVNINYYGTQNSKLSLSNNCLLCGIAKCPYTDINIADTTGKTGDWIYVNSNGISKKIDPNAVAWVGSALFKSKTGSNNFTLLHTDSNDSQKEISNEVIQQSWKVMYYDVC